MTKDLFHAHYAGDMEKWFPYLCADSISLATGEPALFGGDAIREHFKGYSGRPSDIVQEEYYPVALGDQAAQVCGETIVQNQKGLFRLVNRFTISWRLIGGELKMVHLHNSYEYMQQGEQDISRTMKWDMDTTRFVRNLLLESPPKKRIAVRSGRQTLYVNPYTVLYAQSQKRRTELVCVDKVISCNSTIGELEKELPEIFYPLHRGYLVNTLYIVAIRRFEAELISGIAIPIPALTYTNRHRWFCFYHVINMVFIRFHVSNNYMMSFAYLIGKLLYIIRYLF